MEYNFKITPEAPKYENGLAQMIMMGESIRQIWVNFTVGSGADDIIHSIYKVDGDIEHLSPGH